MIFIVKGGSSEQKDKVASIIADLSSKPVYRRSVMDIPMDVVRKTNSNCGLHVTEIFHKYIGDVLTIQEKPSPDRSSWNPGLMPEEEKKDKTPYEETIDMVKAVAKSLTSGMEPLFLFRSLLRKVRHGHDESRWHVLVDLQYKEELELLCKHNKDRKILVIINSSNKDQLLYEIPGLTPLNDVATNEFNVGVIVITENELEHKVSIVMEKLNSVTVDQPTPKYDKTENWVDLPETQNTVHHMETVLTMAA